MIELSHETYVSPDDDCRAPILAAIAGATTSIRVADYTMNWTDFAAALIAKHQAGVDVRLVLDRSEAGVHTEEAVLASLRGAGVPLVIGTSQKHQIMHLKLIVVDGATVVSGSYNFSTNAQAESNIVDIETGNVLRASYLAGRIDELSAWITANEPQAAPAPTPPAP